MAKMYLCDACGNQEYNQDEVCPPADWITMIRESGSSYDPFTEWHACSALCAVEVVQEELLAG
jgi:hypothetical protein